MPSAKCFQNQPEKNGELAGNEEPESPASPESFPSSARAPKTLFEGRMLPELAAPRIGDRGARVGAPGDRREARVLPLDPLMLREKRLRRKELRKIDQDGTFEAMKVRDNPRENEQVLEKIKSQSRQICVE